MQAVEHLPELIGRHTFDFAEKFLAEPRRRVIQSFNIARFDLGVQIFLAKALFDQVCLDFDARLAFWRIQIFSAAISGITE